MSNVTEVFVGVDISKKKLDICILPEKKSFVIANDSTGLDELISELKSRQVKRIVCEPTGGYETLFVTTLAAHGHEVWLVEPTRIHAFRASQGQKAKNDAIDAYIIAQFAMERANKHETTYGKNQELLALVNRRKDLTEIVIAEKNRLEHEMLVCVKEIKEHVAFMQQQLKKLERKIRELIYSDIKLREKAEIIESIPGVGQATSAMLLSTMPELGHMSNKQAGALLGVVPYVRSSGQYKGKATISGGRYMPRTALFMAALVSSRFNPVIKQFYERLIKVGKPAKVALVAVMNKLITIINTMLTKGQKWETA